jgi:hypothetical protein
MEDYESPYRPPPLGVEDGISSEPRHSGLGIASFVVGILSGVGEFAAIVVAGFLVASAPDDIEQMSALFMAIGFAILGGMGLAFVGLALAIAAFFQPDRKKVFAVLGLTFNLLVLLGVCGLMGVGLVAG